MAGLAKTSDVCVENSATEACSILGGDRSMSKDRLPQLFFLAGILMFHYSVPQPPYPTSRKDFKNTALQGKDPGSTLGYHLACHTWHSL